MTTEKYPEHTKLRALDGKNDVVGDFIEWLRVQADLTIGLWRPHHCTVCGCPWEEFRLDSGRVTCLHCGAGDFNKSEDRLLPAHISTPDLLARYFGIDQDKIEAEKRQMLDELRAANAARTGS